MKAYLKIALFSLCLLMAGALASQETPVPQENSKKDPKAPKRSMMVLKVKISGMTCAHGCAKGIEDNVYQLKGVKSSTVDFESMTGTFIFDEVKISKEKIIAAIENFNPGEGSEHKYKVEVIFCEPNK
ncbi:MAG: heavy-metal-associated domain-containing protein [Bacteroidia bacterium]|nr:heavy-metal-associated domain-containing protein [Bacteroidia bacterium]